MGEAILIIGPTGVGKTPLGEIIEEKGYKGRNIYHVDFGAELRDAVERSEDGSALTQLGQNDFTNKEVEAIKEILDSSRLLEESDYWIADRIFQKYSDNDYLVLNGFPRDMKQAEKVSSIVDVTGIIVLNASIDTVMKRIKMNTGGDRAGRTDDHSDKVKQKFEIYEKMTTPLIDHYMEKECSVNFISVDEHSTAENMYKFIS